MNDTLDPLELLRAHLRSLRAGRSTLGGRREVALERLREVDVEITLHNSAIAETEDLLDRLTEGE